MKSIISGNDIMPSQINLLIWLFFCIIAAITFIGYFLTSIGSASGVLLMPVDDAYIHFQYAKQISAGQPYVYNPGLPPSSGATSFLYPYLLSMGYSLGFVDLQLGLWAMLIGGVALLFSTQILFRLGIELGISTGLSLLVSLGFALNGYVTWHFMSGMETGLTVLFVLLTGYTFITRKQRAFIGGAILLALVRPEGSIMAVIAAVLYVIRALVESPKQGWIQRFKSVVKAHWTMNFVLLALLIQPLTNYLLTGAFSASGGQSKSLFGMVPFYWDEVLSRIIANLIRIMQESLIGSGEHGIWYFPPLLGVIVFALVVWHLWKCKNVMSFLLILVWVVVSFSAIATLDTAFWHFKRYQLPVLVLMFPALLLVLSSMKTHRVWWGMLSLTVIFSLWISWNFSGYYAMNVQSVYQQPYAMALWLRENTDADALVAVHDVGMMRYVGERTTVDMVGLTTEGAAEYWRNGPGSTGEFVLTYPDSVDYVAAYTDARGLNYLADTRLYGTLLAGFEAEYDARYNVAVGAPFQGIYTNDAPSSMPKTQIQNQAIAVQLDENLRLVDVIDVANIASEQGVNYTWGNDARYPGFATEFYEFTTVGCSGECRLLDGGRLITGSEKFQVTLEEPFIAAQYLLVTRVHGAVAGELDIYSNGVLIDTQWIPSIPGQWFELYSVLPNDDLSSRLEIEIKPHISGGSYMPYFHTLYRWDGNIDAQPQQFIAEFQEGKLLLSGFDLAQANEQLTVTLDWWSSGQAVGDWVTYVHLYDDVNAPPVLQHDARSFGGGMMPGNWLPGSLSEQVSFDLTDLENGRYLVGIGFYDPVNNIRMPVSYLADDVSNGVGYDEISHRLFLQEIILSR